MELAREKLLCGASYRAVFCHPPCVPGGCVNVGGRLFRLCAFDAAYGSTEDGIDAGSFHLCITSCIVGTLVTDSPNGGGACSDWPLREKLEKLGIDGEGSNGSGPLVIRGQLGPLVI
jgi:hypothetical protein